MPHDPDRLTQAKDQFARSMATAAQSADTRIGEAFRAVPREAFLPPPPWQMYPYAGIGTTSDPADVYRDELIALDPAQHINNGQPSLHAHWMGAVAPRPGETVVQVGAGGGYYTAILARLVQPGGHVHAFEIDAPLARQAAANLTGYNNVTVAHDDATTAAIPACDIIYVAASVTEPPISWLQALRPGGRLIMPWTPASNGGITAILTRRGHGFDVKLLSPVSFIPCIGAYGPSHCVKTPTSYDAWAARSAWLVAERAPDKTAVAIYRNVWFSHEPA